jgi:hypothetical protein
MERICMCWGETDEVTEEWRRNQGGKNKITAFCRGRPLESDSFEDQQTDSRVIF